MTTLPEPMRQAIEEAEVHPTMGGLHDKSEDAAVRARAVRLRLSGMTYQQIADELGYTNKGSVHNVVMSALDRYESSAVADLRAEENARLDRAQAAIWTKVLNGDLRAVDTYLRLATRRARMNGLDAPQQLAITSGAQAALQDALADLRTVVLGEVLDSSEEPVEVDDATF